jgi:hypothetical protein
MYGEPQECTGINREILAFLTWYNTATKPQSDLVQYCDKAANSLEFYGDLSQVTGYHMYEWIDLILPYTPS